MQTTQLDFRSSRKWAVMKGKKMDLYAIRRPSAWADLNELQEAGAKSAQIGNEEMSEQIRWIRSYIVEEPDGMLGSICVYQAQDVEALREHALRVGMPGNNIVPIVNSLIIRPDPQ